METKINIRKWAGLFGFCGGIVAAVLWAFKARAHVPVSYSDVIVSCLCSAVWAWAYFDLATKKVKNDNQD